MAYRRSKRRRRSRFIFWLLVLAIIAGGAWYWHQEREKKKRVEGPKPAAGGPVASQPSTMVPPGGVLTPPIELPTSGPAASRPAMTRPSNGPIQPIPMAAVDVPPADQIETVFQAGMQAWQAGDLLTARNQLNRVLHAEISAERQNQIREILTQIADRTIFSPEILMGDPLVADYVVVSGDSLNKIAKQYKTTEQLLNQINGGANMNFIRAGRRLKVVNGPFHATVVKSAHTMHVYLQNVYLRSFQVALGTDGSTPTGKWVVSVRQTNPTWFNPRAGKVVAADDPENPLGEFWIGLEGAEEKTRAQTSYGIHGTIDEASIGKDVSMGCIRMYNKDVEMVFGMLVLGSTVTTVD